MPSVSMSSRGRPAATRKSATARARRGGEAAVGGGAADAVGVADDADAVERHVGERDRGGGGVGLAAGGERGAGEVEVDRDGGWRRAAAAGPAGALAASKIGIEARGPRRGPPRRGRRWARRRRA